MRVAVFGAAGGVGRQVVRLAGGRGLKVVAVARSVPTGTGGTAAPCSGWPTTCATAPSSFGRRTGPTRSCGAWG